MMVLLMAQNICLVTFNLAFGSGWEATRAMGIPSGKGEISLE